MQTRFGYDATNRVTDVTRDVAGIAATDPLGRNRSTGYTPDFDVASATSGSGAQTSFGYAANGGESLTGITSPTGASVSAAYADTGLAQFLPSSGTAQNTCGAPSSRLSEAISRRDSSGRAAP
ncbi:MAG TPA: hypothetical protein VFJ14_04055 [Nocardioidaceae bacterium]|nr:hypothetical protein [Nocardioidaceae bacterium]